MPRRIETFFLGGPAGKLEAMLEEPEHEEPVEAALVCHPHPLHGGTMHNKVVYRLARGLRKSGCVVLRFNFRGVNLSEGEYDHGVGEVDDALAGLAELRTRYPGLPALVAGFSFGSRVALRLAKNDASLTRAIAVGFPSKHPNREYVNQYQSRNTSFKVQTMCTVRETISRLSSINCRNPNTWLGSRLPIIFSATTSTHTKRRLRKSPEHRGIAAMNYNEFSGE